MGQWVFARRVFVGCLLLIAGWVAFRGVVQIVIPMNGWTVPRYLARTLTGPLIVIPSRVIHMGSLPWCIRCLLTVHGYAAVQHPFQISCGKIVFCIVATPIGFAFNVTLVAVTLRYLAAVEKIARFDSSHFIALMKLSNIAGLSSVGIPVLLYSALRCHTRL